VTLSPDAEVNRVISDLISSGARIFAVIPQRQTLEDYFMREVESIANQAGDEATESNNMYQRAG
jgi:hypothetical protein